MAIWNAVTRDIKVDSLYGDIELSNNDLKVNNRSISILKDTVIERYKTNESDFVLNRDYGANLEKNIGKGIETAVVDNTVASLRYSLTYDNFIDRSSLNIVPIVLNNTIKLYTYIEVGGQTIEINSTYDSDGVLKIDK